MINNRMASYTGHYGGCAEKAGIKMSCQVKGQKRGSYNKEYGRKYTASLGETPSPSRRPPVKDAKMKRISKEEMAEKAVVCWSALNEHEKKSFELVAQAQLESCEEEIGEIFKEIAKLGDGDWGDKEINKLFRRWVQALKQKLGVK